MYVMLMTTGFYRGVLVHVSENDASGRMISFMTSHILSNADFRPFGKTDHSATKNANARFEHLSWIQSKGSGLHDLSVSLFASL